MKRIVLSLLFAAIAADVASAMSPYCDLNVVEVGDGWVRLRWNATDDPSLAGYRIKYSLSQGEYLPMTDWNGYPAAFTFSTDDGYVDNMPYAEILDRYDKGFTVFTICDRVGLPGFLTAADLESLHTHGHEIGSHSMSHPALVRNTAFTIQYNRERCSCNLDIEENRLKTYLDGMVLDLDFDLADSSVQCIYQLVDSIDARAGYSCTLDHYECTMIYCRSEYLDLVTNVDIVGTPYQATTSQGCDSTELMNEMQGSKIWLETLIQDTTYRCRSFAYPRHAHDQREMNALLKYGYLGARNGGNWGGSGGPFPGYAPVSYNYLDRVNICQAPTTWGVNYIAPNDSSEAYTRMKVRERIDIWKANNEWANWMVHTCDEWDSAHVAWALDEIVSDGEIWVAPFGDVAEYVRQYHVTVENPVEAWNDSFTASAYLHNLPVGPMLYAIVVAYDTTDSDIWVSDEISFRATQGCADVPGGSAAGPPPAFHLYPGRPNPANPTVLFPYSIECSGRVVLSIYDTRGERVSVLNDCYCSPGAYQAVWTGTDHHGAAVASGAYFCRIETEWGTETRKALIVR